MNSSLMLGDVVRVSWSSDLNRVVAFDDIEVFFDKWIPEEGRWRHSAKGNTSNVLPRQPADFFIQAVSERVRHEPITEHEFSLFRPDLPLRICRYRHIDWAPGAYKDSDSFKSVLQNAGVDVGLLPGPSFQKVALRSLSAGHTSGPPELVVAENGKGLTALEILWRANESQDTNLKNHGLGIGLYRSGWIRGGVTSYTIGTYHDRCGATKRWEEKQPHQKLDIT